MNNDGLLSQLTTNEKVLVNSEVQSKGKSTVLAYILAIFLGVFGAHRFYMGKTGSGVAMLLITILTLGFGMIITGIWDIVDLFLIPGWIKESNAVVERSAAERILNDPQRLARDI
ncbi:TM2 domain-containing protein [Weissella viridescens]|uniref:TM2 domain-containing protein n=1 Tax=Weissella viridescens TaxID=1629 RepID=A0A3P2RC46_WEIVI|nr:TM2 domain-containing protein [Weissella viridescens]RRG18227.1 TM2 domain-containing protein [Weissella viridescens]